jgi:hypothetical protein
MSWAQQRLSGEQAQAQQQYLSAIGERYDADVVRTAAHEAEWYFVQALQRQPDQSAALVNLGALLAESALLGYIETGTADRARLNRARDLFQQAQTLLEQRPDQEGKIALAQCLLYEAISLPPDAHLEAVHWAAIQTQQLRASLGQVPPEALRLDIAQRNLARRDPSFLDRQKLERARDLLLGAGAMAGLVALVEYWLGAHTQMDHLLGAGIEAAQRQPPPLSHPVDSRPAHTTSPHPPAPRGHPVPQPASPIFSQLLSTAVGKALVVIVVVVLGGSLLWVATAGRGGSTGGGSTDGGWLAQVPGEVYFLQIANGTGEVDYATKFNGQLERFHGVIVVHNNDGTIEVDGMVDGVLKDCSACPYHLTSGNLDIDYQYQPYNGGGPVSGTLTFSSSDVSTYQQDVQQLNSGG